MSISASPGSEDGVQEPGFYKDSWRAWLRRLKQNPVYRRERGEWGHPNPLYAQITRYSPFVVLGTLIAGACAGSVNPAIFQGTDSFAAFYCLLCLPNILLNVLTLYGMVMAPALTAPSISIERATGTWEILLATPQPANMIVAAKLLGSLARLRIWVLMTVLSGLQAGIAALFLLPTLFDSGWWTLPLLPLLFLRPFLDVLTAAVVGLTLSSRLASATSALAGSYGILFVYKLINNNVIWNGLISLVSPGNEEAAWIALLITTTVAILFTASTAAILIRSIRAIST